MPSPFQLRRVVLPAGALRGGEPLPWSPLALSPSFWHDATQLALSDLDSVSAWPDLSGNGRAKTQGVPSSWPVFRTGMLNGLPGVLFDGVDDSLIGATDAGDAWTLWAIWQTTVFATGINAVLSDPNLSSNAFGGWEGVYALSFGGGVEVVGAEPVGDNLVCLFAQSDSSQSLFRMNGIEATSGASGGYTALSSEMHMGIWASAICMYGYVGEAGMIPRVINADEKSQLLSYLSTKWGVAA